MLRHLSRLFHTLSTQIFAMYWVSFVLMSILILLITKFDMTDYDLLEDKEITQYQRDISQLVRDRRLGRLIYEDSHSCEPEDLSDSARETRSVLVNNKNEMLCATEQDQLIVRYFIDDFKRDFERPLKRIIGNDAVIGPFNIFLNSDRAYQLYILTPVSTQDELIKYVGKNPAWAILLVIIGSTPILFWVARFIGRPARELRLAANAVSLGNFQINKKLENQGALEMRLVGTSFNRMTQAINELISGQQELLSSISHELRTPLTRLQLAASILRRRVGDSKELQRIETEIERLDKMINDLLLLSRQQLNSHLLRDVFSINEIWEGVFSDAKFEAEQRNICFDIYQQIQDPQQYYLNGNLELVSSAVENILRNALKYTKNYVVVECQLDNNELFIFVDDNGEGVPPHKYQEIFKPFYRIDEMRTRATGGAGLGLAIVANIISQHHGDVRAEKSKLGGLRVAVKLPLWQP